MKDLHQMLENKRPIKDINGVISGSLDKLKNFPDKLKLVFILLHILQEGSNVLSSIDSEDFISILKEKIDKTKSDLESTSSMYKVYLEENTKLMNILLIEDNEDFIGLCNKIKSSLSEIDTMINRLVTAREKMELKEIADKEKSNG